VPAAAPRRTEISIDVRGRRAARASSSADLQARGEFLVGRDRELPDDLKYHQEHDWARIDGDEAVLGITWFAQDALGELVHYEPPSEGARSRGQLVRRGRVGQGVSDVIAPLSGEVLEVNRRSSTSRRR
jgi:hypothetical protein